MEYMSYIIGGWIIGMTGYTIMNMAMLKNKRVHRCNVKREIIKFKKIDKNLNDNVR